MHQLPRNIAIYIGDTRLAIKFTETLESSIKEVTDDTMGTA